MDLSQLTEEQEYAIKVKDLTLYFTLRDPDDKEDLEYRRRSSRVSAKNGKVESTDASLQAPLWLLDKICLKVECQNGGPERVALTQEEIAKIPSRTRLSVIMQHLAILEGESEDQKKN